MNWIDKIYIISLEKHQSRRKRIYADLDSAGFDVSKIEWINAIDGSKLDIPLCISDGTISNTFRDPNGVLTKSVYGCALSHKNVYKKFLETSDNVKTALVLEDDASITHTLLRVLLPNSFAYTKLIEEKDKFDWDVIVLGGQHKNIEHYETDSYVLKKMIKYPVNYAAHSYVINKKNIQKLIDSNTPIQFAADVNIHCSDLNLYCTPISYFSQKIGNLDKSVIADLQYKFKYKLLLEQSEFDRDEMISSTTYGDYESPENSMFLSSVISTKIKVESIDFKSFKAPNGDTLDCWVNIHLGK